MNGIERSIYVCGEVFSPPLYVSHLYRAILCILLRQAKHVQSQREKNRPPLLGILRILGMLSFIGAVKYVARGVELRSNRRRTGYEQVTNAIICSPLFSRSRGGRGWRFRLRDGNSRSHLPLRRASRLLSDSFLLLFRQENIR